MPFSLNGLTGSTSHDFVNRPLGASTITPGRDWGIMALGRASGRVFTYAIGVFDGDDEVDEVGGFFDDDKGAACLGGTTAGRLTVQRFRRPERLRGALGLPSRLLRAADVKGDRLRAELIQACDERLNQGLCDVDVPKAVARAWYVSGTWLLTGEQKQDAAVRVERLGFGSASTAGEPAFANPRAANLLGNHGDVVTAGAAARRPRQAGRRATGHDERPNPWATRRRAMTHRV